jgi:hypothetical protein
MPPVGFKPTISTGERPQTYALERAANGTGKTKYILEINKEMKIKAVTVIAVSGFTVFELQMMGGLSPETC